MWQGRRGQWDYQLLFTHEEHPGIPFLQSFYVALGAFSPFDLPLTYHIARFALTIGVVLALWAFASHFFEKTSERWLCLLFGTVVSGWSWLLFLISPEMTRQVFPIEFWLIDAFNLSGALFMPHFSAAIILQIVILLAFENFAHTQVGSYGRALVQITILTLAMAAEAIIQPYVILLLVPLLVILTAYHIFSAKRLSLLRALWLIIPMGVHTAIVAYHYQAVSADPVWVNFSTQNITASPLVTYYLLGYLTFIIPIFFGVRPFMFSMADDRWWMPLIWVALVAALLYAPFPTQRRYLLGVQTPLAALAAYGWARGILPRLRRPQRRVLLTAVYMVFASIALILLLLSNIGGLSYSADNPVFYSADELQGYAWLRREANSGDLVLTTFDQTGQGSGGRLVAATGQRVFMGHWIETVDFDTKVAQIRQFYDGATDDEWRQNFLKDIGAVYIWYDDDARALGDWNPATAKYLDVVFESGNLTIFRLGARDV
jgi:hypothetical protein